MLNQIENCQSDNSTDVQFGDECQRFNPVLTRGGGELAPPGLFSLPQPLKEPPQVSKLFDFVGGAFLNNPVKFG